MRPKTSSSSQNLDRIVAKAHQNSIERGKGYREKALTMYPWICGRCAREFDRKNLRELTVHHRDHNHDNNPQDGSNWELLCVYCHDNEHAKQEEFLAAAAAGHTDQRQKSNTGARQNPFANLKKMLEDRQK